MEAPERPVQVICPNPLVADALRSSLGEMSKKVDVLTISRFIGNAFQALDVEKNVSRKSEILKILAVAWKNFNPNLPDQSFMQVYQHLTDLRSFTLDAELIKESIEDYGEDMGQMILRFWYLLDEMDITDEQKAYVELAKILREGELPPESESLSEQSLLFWGFDFFNAGQVDLLKALSLRNDVYCPVPKTAYEKAISSDWVMWLGEDVKTIDGLTEENRVRISYFKKNRLAESLSSAFTSQGPKSIFLAQKNPSLHQISEMSLSSAHFKTPMKTFHNQVRHMQEELKDLFGEDFSEEGGEGIPIQKAQEIVSEEIQKLQASGHQKFLKLKVYSSFFLLLKEWEDISQVNETIRPFDLEILVEILSLNLPRNFWTPLQSDQTQHTIKGLESLETFDQGKETFVIGRGDYLSLKSSEDRYSERMIELLLAIAPVPRKEFEFQFLKQRLQEVLFSEKTTLLLEAGLDEENQSWQDVLKDAHCQREVLVTKNSPSPQDFLHEKIQARQENALALDRVSATKLQNFLDCPRKFYFSYVDPLSIDVAGENEVQPRDLGTLEHECLEDYFTEWKRGNEAIDLNALVTKRFNEFLKVERKRLTKREYSKYQKDIFHTVQKGVDSLLSLPALSQEDLYFEKPLDRVENIEGKEVALRGSIDCIGSCEWGDFVLDFKRSQGSIPSATEVKNFESVQVWFYLYALTQMEENRDYQFWGYLNISDPKNSLVFAQTKELAKEIKASGFLEGTTIQSVEDLQGQLREFQSVFNQTCQDIENEKIFPPRPRKKDICQFCHVKNLCPRTEGVNP